MDQLADSIIIIAAGLFVTHVFVDIISEIALVIREKRRRAARRRQGEKFGAARRAARIATEAKLRAEGRWDNYEIQDAMDAAGRAAAPGYRP